MRLFKGKEYSFLKAHENGIENLPTLVDVYHNQGKADIPAFQASIGGRNYQYCPVYIVIIRIGLLAEDRIRIQLKLLCINKDTDYKCRASMLIEVSNPNIFSHFCMEKIIRKLITLNLILNKSII